MNTQENRGQLSEDLLVHNEFGFGGANDQLQNFPSGYMDLMHDPRTDYDQTLGFETEHFLAHSGRVPQMPIADIHQIPKQLEIINTLWTSTDINNGKTSKIPEELFHTSDDTSWPFTNVDSNSAYQPSVPSDISRTSWPFADINNSKTHQTSGESDSSETSESSVDVLNHCPSNYVFSEKLTTTSTNENSERSGRLEPLLDYEDLHLVSNSNSVNQWWMQFHSPDLPLQIQSTDHSFLAGNLPFDIGSSFSIENEAPTTNVDIYNIQSSGLFDSSSFWPLTSFPTSIPTGISTASIDPYSKAERQWPVQSVLPMRGYTASHTQVPYLQTKGSLSATSTDTQGTGHQNWSGSFMEYQDVASTHIAPSYGVVFPSCSGIREGIESDHQQNLVNGPTDTYRDADSGPYSELIILDSSGNIDGKVASNFKATRARRSGKLAAEKRGKVANVRKFGACWYCRIRKIPCNVDNATCQQCQQKVGISSPMGAICRRESFANFSEAFYGPYKVWVLEESNVKWYFAHNVAGITQNEFEIKLQCCSPKYPLIGLTVHEFVPSDVGCLEFPNYGDPGEWTKPNGKWYTFELVCDPIDTDWSILQAEMTNFVNGSMEVGRDQENDIKVLKLRPFASQIMLLLDAYSMKTPGDTLLKKGWTAFIYEFLLCKPFDLTEESVENVKNGRLQPAVHSGNHLSHAWYLDIQMKRFILAETRTAMADFLVSLEQLLKQEMKQRTKKGWLSGLCALLMLCFMVENGQRLIICYTYENNWDLEWAILEIRQLERYITDFATELFRDIYHPLPKSKNGKGRYSKFNPIRDGLSIDLSKGITPAMSELVDDIRKIIRENRKEMEERDRPPMYPQFPGRRPEWPNLDKEVSDTAAFAEKEMSGRLLSRVLMWFL